MRTISTDLSKILESPRRYVEVRVQIEDGDGTLQDIRDFKGSDWFVGCDWGEDIDSMCMDATIQINRAAYYDSMAPLMKDSRVNLNAGGSWDSMLFLNREVRISIRYAADETADPTPYMLKFKGYVDIIDWGASVITLQCRDKYRTLQDRWIEAEAAYSDKLTGEAIETVLQEILDDNLGGGVVNLYTPVSPGWMVWEFKTTRQSLADEFQLLVDQMGWVCRYVWDEATTAYRLTLYEPDRTKAAVDYTFSQDDYYTIDAIAVDIAGVRNVVEVGYPDSADLRNDGTPKTKYYVSTDSASVADYGRRWMSVTEDASSIINTVGEAQTFADAMVADLKIPKVSKSVTMPLFSPVELGDLYRFLANDVHYSDSIDLAVVSYRHTIQDGKAATKLSLREGAPAGRHLSWFDVMASHGLGSTTRTDVGRIDALTVTETSHGLRLDWTDDWIGGDTTYNKQPRIDSFFEIHITVPGGTPDTATNTTLVGITRSYSFALNATQDGILPVDTNVDVHVRMVSKYAESAFTKVTNKKPLQIGTGGINTDSTVFNDGMGSGFNEQTKGNAYEPDGWVLETGSWNTDAMLDDGSVFTGLTPKFGNKFLVLK